MKIEEIWRDVVGYEGLYQVSNLGRVKSLNYRRSGKERILKPALGDRGYYSVELCKNRKQKIFSVHRLVVEAFLGKIPKGYVVNHINENKLDNRVENLEICTPKENVNHGTCIARRSAARRGQKFSEETRRKMSEAKKAYWQRRRKCVNNGMTTLINLPPRLAAIIEQKIKEDYIEHEVIKKGS